MKDYQDIVKRLRNRRVCVQSGGDLEKDFPLMREAADAIEELQSVRYDLEDGHLYVYRDGTLYRSTVAIPKGKTITVPPFQFNEPPKEET